MMTLFDEVKAAKALSESLKSFDDPELVNDSIESETGLFEIFDRLLEKNGEDKSHIEALDKYIEKLKLKKTIAEERIEKRRFLIAQGIEIAGITTKVKRPTATISYVRPQPKPIITNESAIPSRFFIQQPPKLNKALLNEAVLSGEKIEGVELSNGQPTIRIG